MALKAFLTGSQAYGIPTEESDIDLVVEMDKDELHALYALASRYGKQGSKVLEYGNGQASLRFGNLNLIVCYNAGERAENWKKGTEALKQLAPVPRTLAVAVFEELFGREAGGVEQPVPGQPAPWHNVNCRTCEGSKTPGYMSGSAESCPMCLALNRLEDLAVSIRLSPCCAAIITSTPDGTEAGRDVCSNCGEVL
jgi:hypothetical protein